MECRNCGSVLDPRRQELGYDYCLEDECQDRCMKRIEMATVAVNKAADQYVRAEEVRPPAGPVRSTSADEDDPDGGLVATTRRPRPARRRRPTESTHTRLRRAEARLDAALEECYDRFRRDEITARELDLERNALIRAFNDLVRAENIRYRTMLRAQRPT